jgi:parvulin-like peptidyl-prolyl isomerase
MANEQEVQLGMERFKRELARRGVSLNESRTTDTKAAEEEDSRVVDLDAEELHRTVQWQLSWQRFLKRFQTEENLQNYFASHRRQFDGTQLRVAHLLMKVGSDDEQHKARSDAHRLRNEILRGERTWEAAVREFSVAPTSDAGGDLGLISRHEPMPEPFSAAAFKLKVGDISEPVLSAFGVHLIKCLEVQPGSKTLDQCRSEVERAVASHLFRWAADRERPRATVQVTGAIPLDPGEESKDSEWGLP